MSKICTKLSPLPEGFTVSLDSGFICVSHACKSKTDWDEAGKTVKSWADENKLNEIGTGTDALTFVRDWCFERRKPKRKP